MNTFPRERGGEPSFYPQYASPHTFPRERGGKPNALFYATLAEFFSPRMRG